MKFMKLALSAAALVMALTFGTVNAAPTSLGTVDLDYKGFSQGSRGASGTLNGVAWSTSAGEFRFDVVAKDPDELPISLFDDLLAFCAEVDLSLNLNSVVTYHVVKPSELFSSDVIRDISRLYTEFYAEVKEQGTAFWSAAFQMALWEIIHETDDSYDLKSGTFTGLLSTSGSQQLAQDMLDALNYGGISASTRFLALYNSDQQNLVFIPVPEPGILLLIGSGLLLGGALRRRKHV